MNQAATTLTRAGAPNGVIRDLREYWLADKPAYDP